MAKSMSLHLEWSTGVGSLFIAIIVTHLSISLSYAQEGSMKERTARNAVYTEIGGAGMIGSINYEHLLYSDQIAFRAGFFYIRAFSENGVTVPITTSVLIDLVPGLYAEFGVGATYISLEDHETGIAGTTLLGVRYHPLNGGLFLKAILLPYTTYQNKTFHPGVAIGYSF